MKKRVFAILISVLCLAMILSTASLAAGEPTADYLAEEEIPEEAQTEQKTAAYTVDLSYQEVTVRIPGDTTENLLSDILEQLGIEGEIIKAQVYQDVECLNAVENGEVKNDDTVLYRVYRKDDNNWYIDAVNPFLTEHGLLVTIRNNDLFTDYRLKVTDRCYEVTYDYNGGIGGDSTVNASIVEPGKCIESISFGLPSRPGYIFNGYYDEKTGGKQYIDADGIGVAVWDKNSNATLYAQWIEKGTLTASDFDFTPPAELVYTGKAKEAAITPKSGVTGTGTVHLGYYSDAACTQAADPINVGTYYVGITVEEGSAYKEVTSVLCDDSWTFTISKATLQAENFKFDTPSDPGYTGETKEANVIFNDTVGAGVLSVKYYSDAACTQAAEPINVGTYYVGITVTDGTNYNAISSAKSFDGWSTTIDKAVLTADDFVFTGEDRNYTGEKFTATVEPASGISGVGVISIGYYSDAACTQPAEPIDAGVYYVGITVAEGTNYKATTEVLHKESWKYTIRQRQLSVTGSKADGKPYDGTNVATAYIGTVSGIVSGDDVQVVIKSATFANKDIGNGKDVIITYELTGSKKANYTAPADSTTWADIEKREVSLKSLSATKLYDGTALSWPDVYADLLLTDVDSVFLSEVESLTATGSVTNVAEGFVTNSISYTFKEDCSENNYIITKEEGKLRIFAKELSDCTTEAFRLSFIETGKEITPKPVIKNGDLTLTEGTDYTLSYSKNKHAGTATITIEGKDNYSGTTTVTFEIAELEEVIELIGLADYTEKTAGEDAVLTLGEGTVLKLSDLKRVLVDGTELGSDAYKAEDGCIRITLYKSYLNTLKAGKHVLTVELGGEYEGMKYEKEFTVLAAQTAPAEKQTPNTGDSAVPGLWMLLAGASVLAMGLLLTRKRRKN